jgi:flagellar basal body-associated protein FliL
MKRKIRKRILIFTIISTIVLFAFAVVFYGLLLIRPLSNSLRSTNEETIQNIGSSSNAYDNRNIINTDGDFNGSNYIITNTGFFIQNNPVESGFYLNYSDASFYNKFRSIGRQTFPDGETWRLFSVIRSIGGNSAVVVGGWMENSTYELVPTPSSPQIDQDIENQVKNIANNLSVVNGQINSPTINTNLDGYEVIDAKTNKIIDGSEGIPSYLPANISFPKNGSVVTLDDNLLYLVNTLSNKHIYATSLGTIGDIRSILVGALAIIITIFIIIYFVSTTIFKRYFLLFKRGPMDLDEALHRGEGQTIEYKKGRWLCPSVNQTNSDKEKRSAQEAELQQDFLETVTAFANTNDGTIFLGIDDHGVVSGLKVKNVKDRDHIIHKLNTLVRGKINPTPFIQIDFEEIQNETIAKIFVPRGDEFLYYLDGVSYIRQCESDIKPDPALIKKILKEQV